MEFSIGERRELYFARTHPFADVFKDIVQELQTHLNQVSRHFSCNMEQYSLK
jgi:hypothetical protein